MLIVRATPRRYEWWGAHKKTRDFQYVRVTEVSRTVNAKGDWPWSKLVEQGQWPGGGVQEAFNPKLAGELAQAAWDGVLARVRSLLGKWLSRREEGGGAHSGANGDGSGGSSGRSALVDWDSPLKLRAVKSSPMDGNGPLHNITERGGGFANFGGRSGGHGCFPHWVIFEGCEGLPVAGVEMKAYVAGESPKTMVVETSDGMNPDSGPWRPVASLSADAAWGESVAWARVSEPDPAVKQWSWAPMKLGRYLRLTFTSSFNGDAPTMYYTFFYPPSGGSSGGFSARQLAEAWCLSSIS